ncbi:MAG: hypothetical protein AAF698_07800 [Pseudomonadota bacterium]
MVKAQRLSSATRAGALRLQCNMARCIGNSGGNDYSISDGVDAERRSVVTKSAGHSQCRGGAGPTEWKWENAA